MSREADEWFQGVLDRVRTMNERSDAAWRAHYETWVERTNLTGSGVEFNDYVYGGDE